MATLNCRKCQGVIGLKDVVCPACGFPIARSTRVVRADPATTMSDAPVDGGSKVIAASDPPTSEASPPVMSRCDHVGTPGGAVTCLRCGEPVSTPRRGTAQRDEPLRRAVLVFPWGEHALGPGQVVDVGREVGPLERFLEPYGTVGRRHATLRLTDRGVLLLRDNASTNGTFVNGVRCAPTGEVEVADGAELRFSTTLRVQVRYER